MGNREKLTGHRLIIEHAVSRRRGLIFDQAEINWATNKIAEDPTNASAQETLGLFEHLAPDEKLDIAGGKKTIVVDIQGFVAIRKFDANEKP